MRRNISSVLVVIVGVILAVDVVLRLAPQEAAAQTPADARRNFDRMEQERLLDNIAKALEQQALNQERLIYLAERKAKAEAKAGATPTPTLTTTPIFTSGRTWASDLEIEGGRYWILWSSGEVTAGGPLP